MSLPVGERQNDGNGSRSPSQELTARGKSLGLRGVR